MHLQAFFVKTAAFLLLALGSVLAAPAQAQLVLNLTPSLQSGTPGSTLLFSGTLSNPTASTVFLNGDGYTFSAPGLTLDASPFFNNAPDSLSAVGGGSDTYSGGFFNVFVTPSALPGTYAGTFSVLGGADGNAQATVASETFFVSVQPNSAPVPETSSAVSLGVLFGLGTLAIGICRRRKKHIPSADITATVTSIA